MGRELIMKFFSFLKRPDINEGLEKFKTTSGAVLIDVRTKEEYAERKIDGSINLPLQEIEKITSVVPDKSTPIFLHCRSGKRSGKAQKILSAMGYTNAVNIGGIISYKP